MPVKSQNHKEPNIIQFKMINLENMVMTCVINDFHKVEPLRKAASELLTMEYEDESYEIYRLVTKKLLFLKDGSEVQFYE